MARLSYGAKGKGGPAKGSWGDCYVIERSNIQKRISCGTCINYCKEDKSCNVTVVYPPVDGYDSWKRCEKFDLDFEYDNETNRDKVMRVKGSDYFDRKAEENKKRIEETRLNLLRDKEVKQKHAKTNYKNKDIETKYEKLLKSEWQDFAQDIQKNLCLVAFEKKLHIYPLLDECEWIMKNDFTVNHINAKGMENSLIFLAMLIEKIGCEFSDIISLPENRINDIIKTLFEKELKYSDPDGVYVEENEIGEENVCLKFELYDYFSNFEDLYQTNNVCIYKIFNEDGNYTYIVELFLCHIDMGRWKVKPEEFKHSHLNYQFCIYEGDKNSYVAKFFEKKYKDVDENTIVRD